MPDQQKPQSDLKCPTCGAGTWELSFISGEYGDVRVTEFYRCRNRECDGLFRVVLVKGVRTEVGELWSKLTDNKH